MVGYLVCESLSISLQTREQIRIPAMAGAIWQIIPMRQPTTEKQESNDLD
jgi:hypothetical protein